MALLLSAIGSIQNFLKKLIPGHSNMVALSATKVMASSDIRDQFYKNIFCQFLYLKTNRLVRLLQKN